jgi:hypothetical protein
LIGAFCQDRRLFDLPLFESPTIAVYHSLGLSFVWEKRKLVYLSGHAGYFGTLRPALMSNIADLQKAFYM